MADHLVLTALMGIAKRKLQKSVIARWPRGAEKAWASCPSAAWMTRLLAVTNRRHAVLAGMACVERARPFALDDAPLRGAIAAAQRWLDGAEPEFEDQLRDELLDARVDLAMHQRKALCSAEDLVALLECDTPDLLAGAGEGVAYGSAAAAAFAAMESGGDASADYSIELPRALAALAPIVRSCAGPPTLEQLQAAASAR